MEKNYKEIGNRIKKLRSGKSIPCPECKDGMVSGINGSKYNFACNKCSYRINID